MNWLAHVLLSENEIEYQLGNLLTDPLKGRVWEGASTRIQEGMRMHQRIDAFTDSHPIVKESKRILGKRGPLKGVVLDILYDHFLSLHWDMYCTIAREQFIADFRFHAMRTIHGYPSRAQSVISRVVGTKQLSSYIHMYGVVDAFRRIDARLSDRARSKDTCERYIPLIAEHREVLEEKFLCFFPELLDEVKSHCICDRQAHWRCFSPA